LFPIIGTREILKRLENIVLHEVQELWNIPVPDLPRRKKLCIIVILYDLPTGASAPPHAFARVLISRRSPPT
jgi:hypothetical protein